MPRSVAELENEAKRLSVQERARLAHQLIASLDAGEDVDAEEAWLEEAERRYQAYRQGKLSVKPADKVLHEAKSHLK